MPDSEIEEIGKAVGVGAGGLLAGFVTAWIKSRRNTSGRIKRIEENLDLLRRQAELRYQEFGAHRGTINDSIAGLRDSVERLAAKLDEANRRADTTAENVAYIRGRLNGHDHHG